MSVRIENWKLLVLSIFYVIFAILSYVIEKEQFLSFFRIAGMIIALVGLFQILVYFFKKDYLKPEEFRFASGILYGIAGLIVAAKPYLIVDNYPIVLSALVVLDCTLRMQYSMNLFRLQIEKWKINLAFAVLPLLIAMAILLFPMKEQTLHNLFSFLLLMDGAANFYTVLYYKRILRRCGEREEAVLELGRRKKEDVREEIIIKEQDTSS